MVSRDGFIEVFWSRVSEDLQNGGKANRWEIYKSMEDEFESTYCCNQFPSFDAFRRYLGRHMK